MFPSLSLISDTTLLSPFSSVISHTIPIVFSFIYFNSLKDAVKVCLSLPHITTFAPSFDKEIAHDFPIPLELPVTKAVLFLIPRFMIFLYFKKFKN